MNRNLNRRIHPIAEADGLSPKKNLVKRCRMCKHWGAITYFGKPANYTIGNSHPCIFFKTKSGKYYRCHTTSQLAGEHFEQVNND